MTQPTCNGVTIPQCVVDAACHFDFGWMKYDYAAGSWTLGRVRPHTYCLTTDCLAEAILIAGAKRIVRAVQPHAVCLNVYRADGPPRRRVNVDHASDHDASDTDLSAWCDAAEEAARRLDTPLPESIQALRDADGSMWDDVSKPNVLDRELCGDAQAEVERLDRVSQPVVPKDCSALDPTSSVSETTAPTPVLSTICSKCGKDAKAIIDGGGGVMCCDHCGGLCCDHCAGRTGETVTEDHHVATEPPNVGDILAQWLATNGYDGLFNDAGCSCELNDLVPCSELSATCIAGYRVERTDMPTEWLEDADDPECDWFVVGKRPAPKKSVPSKCAGEDHAAMPGGCPDCGEEPGEQPRYVCYDCGAPHPGAWTGEPCSNCRSVGFCSRECYEPVCDSCGARIPKDQRAARCLVCISNEPGA